MSYRYYCIFRPPMLGAVPRGFDGMQDFGERVYVPEIERQAWGWVEYRHPLTDAQIADYELIPMQPLDNASQAE